MTIVQIMTSYIKNNTKQFHRWKYDVVNDWICFHYLCLVVLRSVYNKWSGRGSQRSGYISDAQGIEATGHRNE